MLLWKEGTMSHPDEGLLHAYLDGALAPSEHAYAELTAHLESCADCRARLEHERALRDDARAILARAAPTVSMPSFDEVRARAAQPRVTTTQKQRISLGRLAIAATVVLAVGGALLATTLLKRNAYQDARATAAATPAPAAPAPTAPAAAVTNAAPPQAAKSAAQARQLAAAETTRAPIAV